jgi:hypothetical protein
VWQCRWDSYDSGQGSVPGSCEHVNENSDYMKSSELGKYNEIINLLQWNTQIHIDGHQ